MTAITAKMGKGMLGQSDPPRQWLGAAAVRSICYLASQLLRSHAAWVAVLTVGDREPDETILIIPSVAPMAAMLSKAMTLNRARHANGRTSGSIRRSFITDPRTPPPASKCTTLL